MTCDCGHAYIQHAKNSRFLGCEACRDHPEASSCPRLRREVQLIEAHHFAIDLLSEMASAGNEAAAAAVKEFA